MRTRMSRALAGSVVFCAIACGTAPAPPEQRSVDSAKPKQALDNSGQLTVHVKDMAKRLKLT